MRPYRTRRSTTTNLLETFDNWSLAINDRASVITAYIDFSKAFDVVSHNKLLQKLAACGIAGNVLSWIKNFLCGRSQVTRVGHSYSDVAYLCSGVIQGSCIGPLLFVIYVNDVSGAFSDGCICKLYADDIKLYSVMRTVNECKNFQESLDALYN